MLFSIMMCTYNSEQTLHMALNSVKNQRFQDWQLIILDNGSKDRTVQILQAYEKLDQRISCIYRENNIGWCCGISQCLKQTKGQYMMFLGADDFLASENTLCNVEWEIRCHKPDIVWTGCKYALYKDKSYEIVTERVSPYRIYDGHDKLQELVEIMGEDIHYNSVMHYVKIEFLQACGIDFFQPFYGDCQGMTEALCRAKKMVVMDKAEYVLTVNTSQTAQKVGFDYDISRQWNSIKFTLKDLKKYPQEKIGWIAERIMRNLAAMLEDIVTGAELRDYWMNPLEKSFVERFMKAEEWISSEAFGEMLFYAGREKYAEYMIGVAGVLYWTCKKNNKIIGEIKQNSKWLAEFVENMLEVDSQMQIVWRSGIGKDDALRLIKCLQNEGNPYYIGGELLLREDVLVDERDRRKIKELLKKIANIS